MTGAIPTGAIPDHIIVSAIDKWFPTKLANLVLWLSADRITGVAGGGAVATWLDQSGTGNNPTQATADLRPTLQLNILNGLPVVRFDGSNDYLTVDITDLTQPLTIFGAFTTDADVTTNEQLDGGGAGAARCVTYIVSGALTAFGGVNLVGATVSANTSYYYVIVYNGASSSIKLSGGAVTNGNAGTQDHGAYVIGADQTPGGLPWGGDIAEYGIYDSALSAADIAQVERYLAAKWGL